MSYTYNGTVYSIASPLQSVSVNKHNIVVRDKHCSQLIKFKNVSETKNFLAWLSQA